MTTRFDPWQVGWRIGRAEEPRAGQLWCPWDRTTGVIGPQGSGKTLDLLTPALLGAPGAALVTLTKADDLLLSITDRSSNQRHVSSWTRSAWPPDYPNWCGTRSPAVWTRCWPNGARKRSRPAP